MNAFDHLEAGNKALIVDNRSKQCEDDHVPFQPVLFRYFAQLRHDIIVDPGILSRLDKCRDVLWCYTGSSYVGDDTSKKHRLRDNDCYKVRLEGVAMKEKLSNERRSGIAILDMFERDIFALSEFHDIL